MRRGLPISEFAMFTVIVRTVGRKAITNVPSGVRAAVR